MVTFEWHNIYFILNKINYILYFKIRILLIKNENESVPLNIDIVIDLNHRIINLLHVTSIVFIYTMHIIYKITSYYAI